ncbi:GNAT family N-acetyltransferase [Companilactobacillus halodurans]|uniref:GNAT family N-acetyltransferase n=1 Tax=Companilactobacillus halodurans TaxID=2584183 RepID=A0A5P0ZP28_9LACO|nr:GNAT family N-acetyltransferase [Companilactobacillus halodurans]MQS76030.1 GNAT family N-acetyltransferase [Companilactobacillus halodurans]MQS96466.1 GNAT family N-acetyltransferase [Companilactobacillus halodurans]
MSNIYLRQSIPDDLPKIVNIIEGAKETLRNRGVAQWQQGYPDEAILSQDINEKISFVLMLDGEVVGTAALQQGYDKNYQKMTTGAWSKDSEVTYSVIHRIAVEPGHQGQHLSASLVQQLLTMSYYLGYRDVRIDTHPDNLVMQHVISSNGFVEKGTITMDTDHRIRKAYQILLK